MELVMRMGDLHVRAYFKIAQILAVGGQLRTLSIVRYIRRIFSKERRIIFSV